MFSEIMGKKHSRQRSKQNTIPDGAMESGLVQREAIHCMASLDDDLYCGNQDGEVLVFDLPTMKTKSSCKVHTKALCKMDACGTNGTYFTASRDKTLSGQPEGKIFSGHNLAVTGIACNIGTAKYVEEIIYKRRDCRHSDVLSMISTENFCSTFGCAVVMGVKHLHHGSQLISGARDCTVALWDINSTSRISTKEIARNLVTDIKWKDNIAVQCSEDKLMKLWDTRTLTNTATFPIKQYFQYCCGLAPDGIHIVSGSVGGSATGCELIIWDMRQLRQINIMHGHTQTITSCIYYATGQESRIITTSSDCSVKVWDPVKEACICSYHVSGANGLTSCVVQSNGSVYAGSLQGNIHKLQYNHLNESLEYVKAF